MSYLSETGPSSPSLQGVGGELVFIRVRVHPRSLEDLLEVLARLDFPINPEIRHGYPNTVVEFPAYDAHVSQIREVLRASGIGGAVVETAGMLQIIG